MIQYKVIDTVTDMIIATSGSGASINYNRIISLTFSNSVVASESKTFRHTTLQSTKRLRGLFIVDKDNLVSLIYDTSTLKTDVATLSLATPSVTYKPSLPIINLILTGVFVSPTVYYIPVQDSIFFQDYTNFVSLNGGWTQGIVYSSDMSSSSCYKMQTSSAIGPYILSIFSISNIATSIYEPSTITLTINTNEYTTIDMI
jgi:hypothetical protein